MSLFENNQYQWRETYFVLFRQQDRPTAEKVVAELQQLEPNYQIEGVVADAQGKLESLTLISPHDNAAMDLTYLSGEEVRDQVRELSEEMRAMPLDKEEQEKLKAIASCDARFDVFHFEEITIAADEEDELLDPGTLLIVLERLVRVCGGVGVDPQSGTLM
jgi:hypothetical protein